MVCGCFRCNFFSFVLFTRGVFGLVGVGLYEREGAFVVLGVGCKSVWGLGEQQYLLSLSIYPRGLVLQDIYLILI